MNTTNLITDYIISGILGVLTFLIPLFMLDKNILVLLISVELKNQTVLAVVITVIGYAFGVIFNQIADWAEDLFYKIFKLDIVEKAETKVLNESGFNHHYALQLIVAKSESAYDYISFRRTMIRIIRAVMCLFISVPLIHLVYTIIYQILGYSLTFSTRNLIIIFLCFFFIFISYRILKKVYKGYYSAITNFALILK